MSAIYRALNKERQEIRLLKLHPSTTFDGDLQCSLFHAFLDSPPEYEALSYVWGPLEYAKVIIVEGQSVNITENLECALRHLRDASSDRVIWVDALCIDQANIPERNHQVTLMKQIYSRCTRDLAWLGPNPGTFRAASETKHASESSQADGDQEEHEEVLDGDVKSVQEGMRIFRNMFRRDAMTLDAMLSRWRRRHLARSRPETRDVEIPEVWLLSNDDEVALLELFRLSPLWSRIWIMQELSCAQRVLLVAGSETLDWDDITEFLGDENKPYADAFHVTGGHHSINGIIVSIFGLVQTIQQQRRIMKDVEEGKYESRLMDVLARFQYADARDPRDIIYGLLGLVSERHPIKVDYAKSVESLSRDVTSFFINTSANLDIICQNPWSSADSESVEDNAESSSWAVSFTNEQRFAHFEGGLESLLFAQRGIFSAGPPTCAVPCDVSPNGLLHVNGVILDEVCPLLPGEQRYLAEEWSRKWMELYFSREQFTGDDAATYRPTGESLFRAFWRTLVMDCKAYPIERLSPEDIEADEKVFAKMLQLNGSDGHSDPADSDDSVSAFGLVSFRMLWRSQGWLFAMSKTGLLLMVGKNAQAGDVLAVLDGGKVPCLLRPCGDGREARYRMAGAVYVHGYMDGRAAADVEEGLRQKQEILLA